MCEDRVSGHVMDYFRCLASSYVSTKKNVMEFMEVVKKTEELLQRQDRLRNANITNTPLESIDDLINNLIYQMDKNFNENFNTLNFYCNDIHKDYDDLNRKMTNLENSCSNLDFRENTVLINGSAFQPKLADLLEYCHDGTRFVHGVWNQLKFSVALISTNRLLLADKTDLKPLLEDFGKVCKESDDRMKFILTMTHFCNKPEQ